MLKEMEVIETYLEGSPDYYLVYDGEKKLIQLLKGLNPDQVILIEDSKVEKLTKDSLYLAVNKEIACVKIVFESNEKNKTFECLSLFSRIAILVILNESPNTTVANPLILLPSFALTSFTLIEYFICYSSLSFCSLFCFGMISSHQSCSICSQDNLPFNQLPSVTIIPSCS